MTVEEELARALCALAPDSRLSWDEHSWDEHHNPALHEHYRARARKLLEQFHVYPRYIPEGL